VCADKFSALPDADAKKAALSKIDSWKRRVSTNTKHEVVYKSR
jgi:hypothetical protein